MTRTAREMLEALDLEALRELGPEDYDGQAAVVPRLVALLDDAQEEVRRRAALALAWTRVRCDAAIPRLTEMLDDPSELAQATAAHALLVLGADEAAPTARLLELARQRDDVALRVWAADGLSDAVPARPSVLPAALQLLDDWNSEVLEDLGRALARCDLDVVLPPLLERVERGGVQLGALIVLAELCHARDVATGFARAIAASIARAGHLTSIDEPRRRYASSVMNALGLP